MKASLMNIDFARIMRERMEALAERSRGFPPHKRGVFKFGRRAALAAQARARNVRLHPRG